MRLEAEFLDGGIQHSLGTFHCFVQLMRCDMADCYGAIAVVAMTVCLLSRLAVN